MTRTKFALAAFALLSLAPTFASAAVMLRGAPYMAASAPDDFIRQGGHSEYGNWNTVQESVRVRAQQYCSFFDRRAQLVNYQVSDSSAGHRLNMIGYGWVVQQVPADLVRPFRDQGITGYARAFDYINCR